MGKKCIFLPVWNYVCKNYVLDFFSECRLPLESAYFGLEIRSRFPGDSAFLSGGGSRWKVAGKWVEKPNQGLVQMAVP